MKFIRGARLTPRRNAPRTAAWRMVGLLLCSVLAVQPASASDKAVFGTMAVCRAANVSLAKAMTRLDQLGWRQVTRRADRSKIAAHMSAGVHHTARGFIKDDYRQMQKMLLENAGRSSRKVIVATSDLTVVYYALGGSLKHQLVLWDDDKTAPNGDPLNHSRTCYLATVAHPSVKAFAALADPVPNLGISRIKGQWVDPRVREYWVRASHRVYPKSGLPFRPLTTDFISIHASNVGTK